jgi:hypothetical protein
MTTDKNSRTNRPADATSSAEPVFVSEVIGDGELAHREVRVGDWTLTVPGAEGMEPEIPDDVLAAKLGGSVYKFRRLIERHASSGNIGPREVLPTVGKTGGRPGKRYLLNEADALFIVTRSETPRAVALTREMIGVYMAARRGLLPRPAPTVPPQLVAEVAELRAQVVASGAAIVELQRELASGTIGPEVAHEKIVMPLRRIAALRGATGRDRKAERARYDRRLRNLLGHARCGATWARLDRRLLGVAEVHVGEWLDAAIRDARKRPAGQLTLVGVEPPKPN